MSAMHTHPLHTHTFTSSLSAYATTHDHARRSSKSPPTPIISARPTTHIPCPAVAGLPYHSALALRGDCYRYTARGEAAVTRAYTLCPVSLCPLSGGGARCVTREDPWCLPHRAPLPTLHLDCPIIRQYNSLRPIATRSSPAATSHSPTALLLPLAAGSQRSGPDVRGMIKGLPTDGTSTTHNTIG